MMNYVKQEERFGCAIACIAMILDKSYQEIKDMLPADRGFGSLNGMTSHDYISFLFLHGFVGMTIYACESHTQKKRARAQWVKPIADVHIVSVINQHGPHAVVWDGITVLDPNIPGRLSIDGYADVQAITGFWKIKTYYHHK